MANIRNRRASHFQGMFIFSLKNDFSYRDAHPRGHFIDDGLSSEKARKLNQGKRRRALSFGFG